MYDKKYYLYDRTCLVLYQMNIKQLSCVAVLYYNPDSAQCQIAIKLSQVSVKHMFQKEYSKIWLKCN